ncbi:MAG: bifunctional phosphoglucose/phosphomannose isomerase [candidate division Zixibacteria bacterium]|nr:bifunctional phosphoglucose/phosphomannose isomerase [candidate division Zixibacteria bacterium]
MSWESILDEVTRYREVDAGDVGSLVRDLPETLEAGEALGEKVARPGRHEGVARVAFLGVGGSGVVGRVLTAYLEARWPVPVGVVREFHVPAWVGEETLALAVSYSGNTLETLAAAEEATAQGASLVALTGGGKLEKLARKSSFPCIKVPAGRPPRCSLGYMAGGLMGYLRRAGVFEFPRAGVVAGHLRDCWLRWGFDTPSTVNDAKKLARELYAAGGAAVYGAGPLAAVAAERCRTQLAENAKYYASGHAFPELCHNELVAFEVPNAVARDLHVVVFRPSREGCAEARQVDAALELIAPVVRGVTQLRAEAENDLAALFELIYFGDLVSYYLSLLRRVDPKPVASIEKLKRALAS